VSDKIENNEMAEACSAYGGGEVCTGFCLEKPEGKKHLGDPGDWRIILRQIFRK
jgi:hypothetical protein